MTTEEQTVSLEEQLGYKKIQEKGRMANDMTDMIEERVISIDKLIPQEALLLGSSYLVYYAEAVLHNEDRFSISFEAAKLQGYDTKHIVEAVNFERLHNKRLELELALAGAQRGDYRGVKVALINLWEYQSTTGDNDSRKLALKFLKMAEIMPDFAEPFVLPSPAWIVFRDLS